MNTEKPAFQNLATLLVLGLIISAQPVAAQSTVFTFQGRLDDSGIPANGTYDLSFSLWTAANGPSQVGSTLNKTETAVSNGLFIVTLDYGGDVFSGADRWLEIAVRTNGIGDPFTTLTPRQPITSTPYAIRAAIATSFTGAVSATNLTGTIADVRLSTNVARLSIDQIFSGTQAFSGAIGIGTTNPQAPLQISGGTTINPTFLAEVKDGVGAFTNLMEPTSVFVSGTVAYVTAFQDNALTIIDVLNPTAPRLLAQVKDGVGGFSKLAGATSVFVSGSRAYVVAEGSLTIIDVNNPAAPQFLGVASYSPSGTFSNLNGAGSVFVSGTRAYVTAAVGTNASLTIIDVSNPGSPQFLGQAKDGVGAFTNLAGATSVFVSGTMAYVTSFQDDALTIVDASNPASPQLAGQVVNGVGGVSNLFNPWSVFVSGTTAYVAANNSVPNGTALFILNVADPASPQLLGQVKDGVGGFNNVAGAQSVFVSGTTAYVASGLDDAVTMIDVSNPTSPRLLAQVVNGVGGFNNLSDANGIFVSGPIAYVTAGIGNALTIFSTPGSVGLIADQRVGIGTSHPTAELEVIGQVKATTFSGSGESLTNLNAANLVGVLADARLSTNVALRDANQVFTGTNAFNNPGNSFTGNVVNASQTISSLNTSSNATIGALFSLTPAVVVPTAASTLAPNASFLRLNPSGPITLNGTTAISNSATLGTILMLQGMNNTNTVTITDGANVQLGAASRVLGLNDTLMLVWNGTDWIEVSFSNN